MKKTLSLCAVASAMIALSTTPAYAKRAAASSPSPNASSSPATAETAPGKPVPFHGMVASVDMKAKTFTISSKKDSGRVFKISDQSVITKSGSPATIKDIVENQEVRGRYWKEADGSLVIRSLKVGPRSEQEKARRAEKKAANTAVASAAPSASPATSPKP